MSLFHKLNVVAGDDYIPGPSFVLFDINATSATIRIRIIDDPIAENDEKFLVELSSPPMVNNYTVIRHPHMAEVVIKDDDHPYCK